MDDKHRRHSDDKRPVGNLPILRSAARFCRVLSSPLAVGPFPFIRNHNARILEASRRLIGWETFPMLQCIVGVEDFSYLRRTRFYRRKRMGVQGVGWRLLSGLRIGNLQSRENRNEAIRHTAGEYSDIKAHARQR